MGRRWQRLKRPDAVGAVRRNLASVVDGVWAPAIKRLGRSPAPVLDDGDPRIAVITVNFSTTQYLKLMLATLADQSIVGAISQVIIVDNGSRDGGLSFLRSLDARVSRIELVERHRFPSHAHGMRAGVKALRRAERDLAPSERANLLLFCDADVIWLNPDALLDLTSVLVAHDAALVGEVRMGPNPQPDIQASLFMVRRSVYDDRSTPPPVDHGSPAYRLQRSIFDRGLTVVDFPSNFGGYTLHRGRAGVAAAVALHPRHAYGHVVNRHPHFMGVPDGAATWSATESEYASLVDAGREDDLVERLAEVAFAGP